MVVEFIQKLEKSELPDQIQESYSLIWKINLLRKKQKQLEEELELAKEEFDKGMERINTKIDLGYQQRLNMKEFTEKYIQLLKKYQDIVYLGFLE